jgi:hypothetical protein
MIPKGFLMMLKQLLPAFGIRINPEEVETMFNNIKVWVPELITYTRQKLDSMDSRLAAIEENQKKMMERLEEIPTDAPLAEETINGR